MNVTLPNTTIAALKLSGITKQFGPVHALRGVDLQARSGSVHAIVGENGAGKSTLLNVATGIIRPSQGSIEVDGRSVGPLTPKSARQLGISVAFQHPALAPDLTVRENLSLVEPGLAGKSGERRIAELLEKIAIPSLRMKSSARVDDLSLAQLYIVEIARALATKPKILFLDEPTEPFQEQSVKHLFSLIGELRDSGVAILYVSHRLSEVLAIADTISVMRDGQLVKSGAASSFDVKGVVDLIAGRPIEQMFPQKSTSAPGRAVMEINQLSGRLFSDVSASFHEGEIVGLTGIEGQGQREFIRSLAGLEPITSGKVSIDGVPVETLSGSHLRSAGVGFVPDDRHSEGLFLPLTIRENVNVGTNQRVTQAGVIDRKLDTTSAEHLVKVMGVKARSVEAAVTELSGGNQQKVLLGRELASSPRSILIDEPTRGVDVGARSEIYKMLRARANAGEAVVVSSADGSELEGLCDRVLVFAKGGIGRELKGQDVADTKITEANITLGTSRAEEGALLMSWMTLALRSLYMPAGVLTIAIILIVAATSWLNPYFFSAYNASGILALASVLVLVSVGQLCVTLMGEIDLSVGPLAGLVVVLASFFLGPDISNSTLLASVLGILLFCTLFGLVQGCLVEFAGLPSVIVTLCSFIGLQGVSLILRPVPGGMINQTLPEIFRVPLLGIPSSMVFALLVVLIFEWVLRSRPLGRTMRAVGSDAYVSYKLGVNRRLARLSAFCLASVLAGCAGLVLASQVGIGSPTTGIGLTLQSITAVVLSGASVTGGVGSFISTLVAVSLIQVMISATSFVNVASAWQYWLVGGATLIAAAIFNLGRRTARGR